MSCYSIPNKAVYDKSGGILATTSHGAYTMLYFNAHNEVIGDSKQLIDQSDLNPCYT
jgi:hypothetical protein